MPRRTLRYRSYFLRCWEEDAPQRWRFMLENPHSGEKRGFESWKEMLNFVETELAAHSEPGLGKERGT